MHSLDERVIAGLRRYVQAAEQVRAQASRTNAAQRAKDALELDPLNLDRIHQLGCCYAEAGHWVQCRNVLLRGRGRLQEIQDMETRFRFAVLLCEAHYHTRQLRDALTTLVDIPEQSCTTLSTVRAILACRVYGAMKDRQKAVKEFCRAINGQDFDSALRLWALARMDLRTAGAYENAKNAMERLADGDEGLVSQLGTLEDLADVAPELDNSNNSRLSFLTRRLRTLRTELPLRLQRWSKYVWGLVLRGELRNACRRFMVLRVARKERASSEFSRPPVL